MSSLTRIKVAVKAVRQLGPAQMGLNALYRLGLWSGHYQRTLRSSLRKLDRLQMDTQIQLSSPLASLPDRRILREQLGSHIDEVIKEADDIIHGYVRLFGSYPVPLDLAAPKPLLNWTKYQGGNNRFHDRDIKFTWEAGRFGWACKLAMAYHLSGDERYAASFWQYTEQFLFSNPPYKGPHWSSAQEVAIRLVSLAFASQVFSPSAHTTPQRLDLLKKAFAVHAERIPPTLIYARSQNNNHLVTEALGLYTASAVLPGHPLATKWRTLGWKWLLHAFQTQILPNGTYTQHSTNYHRLMLQTALWMFALHENFYKEVSIPADVIQRIGSATNWLWKLTDPGTGHVPNLGHNDGAYILPLTVSPFADYRPVLYAAARAFLHTRITPEGKWGDMASWFGYAAEPADHEAGWDSWQKASLRDEGDTQPPFVLVNHNAGSWAAMNVEKYHSRPAHADQLHVDLWWRGLNIALDPGTYLYNAPPPWENSLTSAFVHNTITIDDHEFMYRAGRFLYLDWAQASLLTDNPDQKAAWKSLNAQHDGYHKIGVTHSRMVTTFPDGHWEIVDLLDGQPGSIHTARLHWLLPDWDYEILDQSSKPGSLAFGIRIRSPYGWIEIKVNSPSALWKSTSGYNFILARAGGVLHGSGIVAPITGWTSPTYGDKIPALAFIVEVTQELPIDLRTEFTFPAENFH